MAIASASMRPTDMKRRSVALLVVAAGLFAAWIAYLAFLAVTASHPVVLSRPQFLVADLWVIADVDVPKGSVTVREVVYAAPPVRDTAPKAGTTIEVKNLGDCKGWTGNGRYILPLVVDGSAYGVPPIPRSPGYGAGATRVYPDRPETRDQLNEMRDRRTQP